METIWKSVGLGLMLFVLIGFILYPILCMVIESVTIDGTMSFENYGAFFDLRSTSNIEALWNSLWVSVVSVLICGLIGTGLAVVFSEFDLPLSRFLSKIAVLPIALPPLVGVLSFFFLVGESGIIPRAIMSIPGFGGISFGLEGFSGVIVVHSYVFYVYFYLFASAALSRLDSSLIEAAENLGSSRLRTLLRVILPQLRPALVGASLLTFMMSMASFTAPLIFAADKRFLTLQIFNAKLNGDFDIAATQSVVLSMIAMGFLLLLRLSSREWRLQGTVKGVTRPRRVAVPPGGRLLRWALSLTLAVLLLLPLLTVLLISFVKEGSWTWQILPQNFTVSNYADLFMRSGVFEPIRNSLIMSGLATFLSVLFGFGVAYATVRGRWRWGARALETVALLPAAIPGTVLAINFILAFNSPTLFAGYRVLVGTFWILPLAYFVRNMPLVVRSSLAGLEQIDPSLDEAAKNLGASWTRRLRRVLLPVLLPSIISGGLLTFIACMGDFVTSIMLYTVFNRPIAVEIFSQLRLYNFGGAAAYSMILLVLIVVALEITVRSLGGRRSQLMYF
ncbi:MAG: ABC transporter permease [Bacteroidota bacterium]